MATRIGCDSLVYAVMTAEETASANPVYGVVKPAPGVMSVGINPNGSLETLFADDGPMEQATTLGKIEVEIKKNELTVVNRADLLGHKIDADGALVYGDADSPPYVAIGFRTLKSNGLYRYIWLYKGRFTDPEEQNETKGDGINFQADTIKGQFSKVNRSIDIGDGRYSKPWKYELDEDYAGHSDAAVTAWFTDVRFPSAAASAAAAALVVAYAAGTATGSTKATITGAAGAGNHFAYVISSVTPPWPLVNDPILGATTYTSAADILSTDGVAAGKVLTIYELTAANAAVKYATHIIAASEIKSA